MELNDIAACVPCYCVTIKYLCQKLSVPTWLLNILASVLVLKITEHEIGTCIVSVFLADDTVLIYKKKSTLMR